MKNAYLKSVLLEADQYSNAGYYVEASTILLAAKAYLPDSKELSDKQLFINKSRIFAKLPEYESSGDYAGGIKYLQNELTNIGPDNDLQSRLEAYKIAYRNALFNDVDTKLATEGYASAWALINSVDSVLPNDPEIESKRNEVAAHKPVYLHDLDYFTTEDSTFGEVEYGIVDNLGQEHEFGIRVCYGSWSHSTETYRINKEYSRFSGTFLLTYASRDERTSSNIQILCDGVLVYNSPTLEKGVEPIPFSINVSGVTELRIQAVTDTYSYGIYICDGILEK